MERVAGYIRVSSQEQKLHGYSLDAQRMKLQDYADSHGMELVKIYADEGISGRRLIKNRPALQKMIQAAERREFDRIIFIKLDRFFRSVAEYHECMKRISPVTWTTTEEDYDLTTANGRMLVNMKLTIAELEADQTGERIKLTNEYKVKQGLPLTNRLPFGYMIGNTPQGKRIVKNPETAPIMEDLIDHYLTHQSKRGTLLYILEKYGICIHINSMSKLLKNPMICGEYRGNQNYTEPYVDRETFNKIQKIAFNGVKKNTRRTYLFTGLMRCPICGRKLGGDTTPTKSKEYKYYRCRDHANTLRCPFKWRVVEEELEQQMLDRIEPMLNRAKALRAVSTKKDTAAELAKISGELQRLNYSWQKGRIDPEVYDKEFVALKRRQRTIESLDDAPDYDRIAEILKKGWKEIYGELTDESKRAFWRSFVAEIRIKWDDEAKEITDVIFL